MIIGGIGRQNVRIVLPKRLLSKRRLGGLGEGSVSAPTLSLSRKKLHHARRLNISSIDE